MANRSFDVLWGLTPATHNNVFQYRVLHLCHRFGAAQQRRACNTRCKPLRCIDLFQCGKQDLNLHDLAITRPST